MRAPHLHSALRGFCLGAFALFSRDVEQGAEIPFVFEEHDARDRPTLYEYRPLVRNFVEARGGRLLARGDTAIALDALGREPAAAIFARAHAGAHADHALFRTVLLPLVADVAEACGGFDWDDDAFDRAYALLEHSLFGEERAYAAIAPLVGVEAGGTVALGDGLRVRHAADGELVAHWPDAAKLVPDSFGRETDRMCVLELERTMPPEGGEPPDAPGEIADAITALRLATSGPIAAGPVLFERLDWRPFGVRPVLPIAATQPPGEPTRLDVFRGGARVLDARAAWRRRRRPRARRRARPLGARRSSRTGRSARSSSVPPSTRCLAWGTGLGRIASSGGAARRDGSRTARGARRAPGPARRLGRRRIGGHRPPGPGRDADAGRRAVR